MRDSKTQSWIHPSPARYITFVLVAQGFGDMPPTLESVREKQEHLNRLRGALDAAEQEAEQTLERKRDELDALKAEIENPEMSMKEVWGVLRLLGQHLRAFKTKHAVVVE